MTLSSHRAGTQRAALLSISYFTPSAVVALNRFTLQPCVFFFQAEDGIRDSSVTGVQTCALPICFAVSPCKSTNECRTDLLRNLLIPGHTQSTTETNRAPAGIFRQLSTTQRITAIKIGRASCRERV